MNECESQQTKYDSTEKMMRNEHHSNKMWKFKFFLPLQMFALDHVIYLRGSCLQDFFFGAVVVFVAVGGGYDSFELKHRLSSLCERVFAYNLHMNVKKDNNMKRPLKTMYVKSSWLVECKSH